MPATAFKNNKTRLCLASLSVVVFLFTSNACTVKRFPVQPGTIPKLAVPGPDAEKFGKDLLQELRADSVVCWLRFLTNSQKQQKSTIFAGIFIC